MKLFEQFEKDRQKFKDLPDTNSRITFIWDYYKIPILTILTALLIASISFFNNLGRGDVLLFSVLLNNDSLLVECDEEVFDRLMSQAGYDMEHKRVDVNTELSLGRLENDSADAETLQVINALFMISDLDVYVADEEHFDYFAQADAYADLSLLINSDLLGKHRDRLHYYEDSNGKKALIGVVLTTDSPLHKAGYYHDEVIIGIAANAVNLDEAIAFFEQILSD